MKNAKLSKFPVTAPDGTKFRVTIRERYFSGEQRVYVYLYRRRKRFGLRKVFRIWYWDGEICYDVKNPDFIGIAQHAIEQYAEWHRRKSAERSQRADSIAAFNAWDGQTNEEG